ncbi:ion channel [Sinorhizobium sp. BG8]|uniref:ion channel n=1 Tax=Sinorhizobium sp. BG8 TaxID=2613773 RepID=UPI00193C9344|nr:ion channel [Sinorhizobium sp. BG8]QRM57084.1 two pore domain potassium channel family protein [Sinorhizobium sp. BG8]
MIELSAPNPILEVILGTLTMIAVIFVHGAGIRLINRRFNRAWIRLTAATPLWRLDLLLALTIGSLASLHFAETLLWAAPLVLLDIIPTLRDSYYFVLESYTTLGDGSVTLPDHWRLIGPIIAMSGLFTFGWTVGVLVNIMTAYGKADRERAERQNGAVPAKTD